MVNDGYGEVMESRSEAQSPVERRQRSDALMIAVKDGSREAFRELFQATSPMVYGIVLHLLRSRAEADEVHQEVYMRVWTKCYLYDAQKSHAETWIAHMARHAAIDRLRQLGRRPVLETFADDGDSGAPGPEAVVMARSELRVLNACMAELDQPHRLALRAAYIDGLSYEELAQRFQIPLNTIRSWLRRSLMRLRSCFADHGGGADADG